MKFPCDRAVSRAAVCNTTAWQTSSYLTASPSGFPLQFPALKGQSKTFSGASVALNEDEGGNGAAEQLSARR